MSDDQQPKYLNSPDTPLFSKSDTLYGLDFAKDAIKSENLAVIVEGYADVIIAHQAGFKNVVASLGTALTEKQLAQLARLTKRYALALDADDAGEAATQRGLELARQALTRKQVPVPVGPGMIGFEDRLDAELSIVTMPEGRDPDEVILESPQEWRELIENATPLVDYNFRIRTRDLDLKTAHGKAEAVKRLVPIIAELNDSVQRAHYVQELARLAQVDERVISDQLKTRGGSQRSDKVASPATTPAPSRPSGATYDEYILTLAMYEPALLARVAFLTDDDFERAAPRSIWRALHVQAKMNAPFDVDDFVESLDEATREVGDRLRNEAKRLQFAMTDAERETETAAYRLRLQRYRDELTQLRHLLADAPATESAVLSQRVNVVGTELVQLQHALETRTLLKKSSFHS